MDTHTTREVRRRDEARVRADAAKLAYQENGQLADLERAEEDYRCSLEGEEDASKLADVRLCLADVLRMKCDFTGGVDSALQSVDLAEKAVASTGASDPDLPDRLLCLSCCQLSLLREKMDEDNMANCRATAIRLIEICPPDHPRFARVLTQYAETYYLERNIVSAPLVPMKVAKSYVERALAILSDDDPEACWVLQVASSVTAAWNSVVEAPDRDYDLPIVLAERALQHKMEVVMDMQRAYNAAALACYFKYYFIAKGTQDFEALDASLRHLQSAADSVPPTHRTWSQHQANLAGFYLEKFEIDGSLESIDKAINIYRMVLPQLLPGHQHRANRLSYLGRCLRLSFHHRGGVGQLDEAIEVQREAVELSNAAESTGYLLNLSHSLLERFMHQREQEDLDQAIVHLRKACEGALPFMRNTALADLAYALSIRSSSSHSKEDLDEAIDCFQKVQAGGSDVIDVPRYQFAFGSAMLHKFQQYHDLDDLILANDLFQKAALASTAANVAEVYCKLGISNRLLFHARPHTDQLELSITNLRRAVEETQPGHSEYALHCYELAFSLRDRYYLAFQPTDWTEAVALLEAASKNKSSLTKDRWNAAKEHARLLHGSSAYDAALRAYRRAIELMPRLAWLGLDQRIRYETSQQWIRLGSDAAACAISAGHMEQAVELLESSRSVLWNQLYQLGQEQGDLRSLAPDLASELESVGRALESNLGQNVRLQSSEPRGEDEETRNRRRMAEVERIAAERRRLAERWDVLMDQVRVLPESAHFLGSAPFDYLREAASAGPVVLLNMSQYRCDGLIVTHKSPIRQFPLPTLRLELIELWAVHLILVLQQSKDTEGLAFADRVLDRLLAQLWQDVGHPMWYNLQDLLPPPPRLGRVWLLPTGALASLPLHASMSFGPVRFGLPDLLISSYTPTLTALIRARKITTTSHPYQAQRSVGFRILAVGQPAPAGRKPLPCWAQEKAAIQRLFPPDKVTILEGEQATVERVISELHGHNFVHICSHGEHDWKDPFKSRLILHGGPLTLNQIAQQRFASADFAFLSACHTARVDPRAPDESVHLASGMNLAGFRSIIATMWGIADLDAPAATRNVYEHFTRQRGGSPDQRDAAEALHHAVTALRRSGVPVCRWAPFIHIGV